MPLDCLKVLAVPTQFYLDDFHYHVKAPTPLIEIPNPNILQKTASFYTNLCG